MRTGTVVMVGTHIRIFSSVFSTLPANEIRLSVRTRYCSVYLVRRDQRRTSRTAVFDDDYAHHIGTGPKIVSATSCAVYKTCI